MSQQANSLQLKMRVSVFVREKSSFENDPATSTVSNGELKGSESEKKEKNIHH